MSSVTESTNLHKLRLINHWKTITHVNHFPDCRIISHSLIPSFIQPLVLERITTELFRAKKGIFVCIREKLFWTEINCARFIDPRKGALASICTGMCRLCLYSCEWLTDVPASHSQYHAYENRGLCSIHSEWFRSVHWGVLVVGV